MSYKLSVSAFYCAFDNSHHQSIKLYSNDMLERRCVHNLISAYADRYKRKYCLYLLEIRKSEH